MARSYPLAASAFFGGLRIGELTLDLGASVQISRTRGGEIIPATLGSRLWSGRASLWQDDHAPMDGVRADLFALAQSGASFMVRPIHRSGPQSDPTGAALSGFSPVLHTIDANRRDIRINGLPPSFVLTKGDYLAFTYGSNPTRYAFHQVVVGAIASGAGLTPLFEVIPAIRDGAATSAAVQLVDPAFKALMMPDDWSGGTLRRVKTGGAGFSFVQTFGQ